MALMATLPGRPLYEAYGFQSTGETIIRMPNGVEVAGTPMEMPIS
jgi:hypothetical protein